MEDQDFRIFCNMLDGLAFLSIANLPEGGVLLYNCCHCWCVLVETIPTKVKNLLFHPSPTLLVLGSLSTVAECTLHIDEQVLLQKRLQNQCNDRISGRKTIAQFLHGVAFNIRLFVLPTYVHESALASGRFSLLVGCQWRLAV
jgi:hypothetical protein